MKRALYLAALTAALAFVVPVAHAQSQLVRPYERDSDAWPFNHVDKIVLGSQDKLGIAPANVCSDEVFFRRVHLDVTGTLPDAQAVREFLGDTGADKRTRAIDALLESDAFADYWSLKWCDLLRVKAEYPIKLWPNAVQAYHRWIHESIRQNKPINVFARELLTSSGSNFRVPPVNFYRAAQDHDPATLAGVAALTLMGTRTEAWPQDRLDGMAVFFSRIAFKPTAEWKEEIVYLDPAPVGPLAAAFPDGRKVTIQPDQDPRVVFADWLLAPDNPWFARNMANRAWAWLMGRGIIHEPDDIRKDNPPSNPELLTFLEKELVDAKYDMRQLFRLILNSRTYQQSCIPRSEDPRAAEQFAYYPVRRLEAEVLIDAICKITGTGEQYSSPIPEPFTWVPEHQSTVMLSDGSITSEFLELFGRPSRDTGLESERSNEPNDRQVMHVLNSGHIRDKISKGPGLKPLTRLFGRQPDMVVTILYARILSRRPTQAERDALANYWAESKANQAQKIEDAAWALINSKEFMYRH